MTQGIRAFCNAKFAELLPMFQSKELDGTAFRAKVMSEVVAQFSISVPAAATHYNHSFKTQRAADPKSVAGLGRAEDKKGGRPVVKPVTVIKVKTGEVVATGISQAKANEMIAMAAAKKKAKLAIEPMYVPDPSEVVLDTAATIPNEAEQAGLQNELAEAQATA